MQNWEIFDIYRNFFYKENKVFNAISKHGRMPNPIDKNWLDNMSKSNAIVLKKDLVEGSFYYGSCRNSRVAIWDGTQFIYVRTKFGSKFKETINHPEDDNGFDLFHPYFLIKEKYLNIPYIKEEIELHNKV